MAEDSGPRAPSGPLWEDTPVPFEEALDGTLGFQVLSLAEEYALGRVAVTDRVRQMWGLAHSGAYMALAEMLTSEATLASVHDDGMIAVGLSNHTSFLRPVERGTIHAEARRLHGGKTKWLWEVYLKDDDKLRAVSRVTLAVRPRPDNTE